MSLFETMGEIFAPPTENEKNLIDHLTYSSYRHNRNISPNITPEQWKSIFSNADEMEKKYQEEIKSLNSN